VVCSLGQSEILDWLQQQRDSGDNFYYTAKEVYEGMIEDGIIKRGSNCFRNGAMIEQLRRLSVFDKLEFKIEGTLMRATWLFRAKKRTVRSIT